jgi:hypothetical protein
MVTDRKIILAILGLVGLAILVSGCPGSPMAQRWEQERQEREFREHPPAYLPISYYDTSGQVGYHMVASPRARCGATWNWDTVTLIGGSLPPGLYLRGSKIEGTPTQPGNWQVTLEFTGLECRGKTYPDQDVSVNFTITGYAQRKVR